MIGFQIHRMDKDAETPLQFTDEDAVANGVITDAVVMEGGMKSGEPSVAFKIVVDLPEPAGRIIILAQTSANLIDGLNSAIKGMIGFWADQKGGIDDESQE